VLDDGHRTPETNVEYRTRVTEADVGEWTRRECVAGSEHQVIEFSDALEKGCDR
jgi:hypothetical protein